MSDESIVIVGASRTPMGAMLGSLSSLKATELGATAIRGAINKAGIEADKIDSAIMGCVLSAGLGQAPARQAALGAKLSENTSSVTVNKMCGSGMQSIIQSHDSIQSGSHQIVVAGGLESMSNAPYLISKARHGYRLGHGEIKDHMFLDGLEDAYDEGTLMGKFADEAAERYQFTREEQDEFAIESVKRAQNAIENNTFDDEISPVSVISRKSKTIVETDELPGKARIDKIPELRPAFSKNGTVTAANASSISDGAAAVILMRESEAEELALKPVARILGHSTHAQKPSEFTSAPVGAIGNLFKKINMNINDFDIFEINEAFAVVTMIAMKELGISHSKVNIYGGACALGHPIGASGARIIVTLLNALKKEDKRTGLASLCIGGGEATAIALERIS